MSKCNIDDILEFAIADEIAASRPSGKAGEVYRAMEKAGFIDPAVSLGDGILTVMVRSKEYDKVLSADVSFSFTADRKLRVRLEESGLPTPEGTLYPLLRRLESLELLTSDWRVVDGRPRRYYRLSRSGRRTLASMKTEWETLLEAMDRLLTEPGGENS